MNIGQAARQRPCADVITDLTGGDEQVQRAPLAVADGVQLRVPFLGKTFHWTVSFFPRTPSSDRSDVHAPLFDAHAGRCSVGLQIRCIDHHGLLFAVIGSQTRHQPGEDALIALPLPAILERLVRAIGRRRVPPPQPVAVDEDNPTRHTSVIDAGFAMGLREEGLKTRHLRLRQPEKIRHGHRSFQSRESRHQAEINRF